MSKREEELLRSLLDRHLRGLTTSEEDQQLLSYFESFQDHPRWNAMLDEREVVRDRMLENIRTAVSADQSRPEKEEGPGKIIPIPGRKAVRKLMPYAAAASVVIAVTVMLWEGGENRVFEFNDHPVTEQSVKEAVSVPQQVTLTLENGSEVELGEGQEYQSEYAKSQGESIVYGSEEAFGSEKEQLAYNEITVPRGKSFNLTLSDQTRLWINSESKVRYPVKFSPDKERMVELVYGEVYLDVTPSEENNGTAFVLRTSEQELRVLGTAFNVRAYKGASGIATTLVEGRIAVTVNDQRHILNPSDQLVYNRTEKVARMQKVDPIYYTSWKDGILNFEGMPLENIMRSIGRWYDVEVVFENDEPRSEHFSGVVRRSQTIEQIIAMLQATDDQTHFTINNDTIYVK